MRRAAIICLLLLGTVAVYWPISQAGFLNFDDGAYVANNPQVFHGLTWRGVTWAFGFHAANWHPLTWLSHMLDCQWFGDRAPAHHWVNVGFHSANALLLFLLLDRLTRKTLSAGFVAALFAWHPLHVESVAWISERKDVLSTFLFLLTLHAYAHYAAGRRNERATGLSGGTNCATGSNKVVPRVSRSGVAVWYGVAVLLYALGLMAKPMLVTLPLVLLLLDIWPLGRVELNAPRSWITRCLPLLAEKVPFVLLALGSAAVTLIAQQRSGAVINTEILPLSARALNALTSYCWYVEKCFWPSQLAAYYAYPAEILLIPGLVAGVIVLVITVLAVAVRRRLPFVTVGWLWYLLTLVPVIGLVQVGGQMRADRYSYVPLIGIFVAMVWSAGALLGRWRYGGAVLIGLGSSVLVAAGVAASFQVRYWRDSVTLFTRALEVSPENNPLSHHNLGHALSLLGEQRAAQAQFREALQLRPNYPVAEFNWANSLGYEGHTEEAIAHYREAIRLDPKYEQAYYNLGKALVLVGDLDGGKSNFIKALELKPDYGECMVRLGNLLLFQGQADEGMRWLRHAVQTGPAEPESWYFLGAALARQKCYSEAITCLRTATRLQPPCAAAYNDLAWLLASQPGDGPNDAVALAHRACELTRNHNPGYLDTLAVALDHAGRTSEAAQMTEQALSNTLPGEVELRRHLQNQLREFRRRDVTK